MTKPSRWRALPHAVRRRVRTLSARTRGALLLTTALCVLALLAVGVRLRAARRDEQEVLLFIAIGSAPKNAVLRRAARESWLRWLPKDGSVKYRFFSDAPPFYRGGGGAEIGEMFEGKNVWRDVVREARVQKDLMLQPLPSGYGDNEHNVYGRRALFQFDWALREFSKLRYFLRVDDDSFLCVDKLMYEMRSVPKEQFFWGKFWCREGRNRADENFMLFSRDVIELFSSEQVGRLLPFDEQVTLGWNFGYWSWVLNMSIFDDQERIDAQQSYVTEYMHDANVGNNFTEDFCERFLFAHHVGEDAMRRAFHNLRAHVMYKLPHMIGPEHTCESEQRSFIPKRHSDRLPDVKISRSNR